MSLSEIAISGIFAGFNKTTIYIHPDITLLILISVLSKTLYFIGLRITMIVLPGSISEWNDTNRATILLNIIPLISLFIDFALVSVLLYVDVPKHFRYLLSFSAVLLLLTNITIFYFYHYTQQKNREFTELQLQLQKEYDMTEYYKTLFRQNENQQILIHDIRNHLFSIAKLNEQNEQEQISRYLDTLLNSSDLQNSVHVSDNELLNSLLCHYLKIAQEKNISLKVDARKKLLQNLDYTDLTALFCNLLDNAIEACTDIPDSYIELSITNKENTDITIINMINTCRISPAFNKSGRPVSRKKNKWKHGLGLKSVERIVNKYHGDIKMYFNEDRMTFHTIILIRKS